MYPNQLDRKAVLADLAVERGVCLTNLEWTYRFNKRILFMVDKPCWFATNWAERVQLTKEEADTLLIRAEDIKEKCYG